MKSESETNRRNPAFDLASHPLRSHGLTSARDRCGITCSLRSWTQHGALCLQQPLCCQAQLWPALYLKHLVLAESGWLLPPGARCCHCHHLSLAWIRGAVGRCYGNAGRTWLIFLHKGKCLNHFNQITFLIHLQHPFPTQKILWEFWPLRMTDGCAAPLPIAHHPRWRPCRATPSWHTQNGRPKVPQRPAASLLPTKGAAVSLQSSQAACEGMGCQLEEGRLGCGVWGAEETLCTVGRRRKRRRPSSRGCQGRPEQVWRWVLGHASGWIFLWQESVSVGYQGYRKFNSNWCWCPMFMRRILFRFFF